MEIVDCLERMGINVLFVIGGDGTLRGARTLVKEITERGAKIAVVGMPKTIDNDIPFIDQSFGFQTAFSEATEVDPRRARRGHRRPNGVGLVKLMGRHSGFIACYAALAMSDANFVLIPEVPFCLDGENGFLNVLRQRVEKRGHAVVVVAEGAGQDLVEAARRQTDASGNAKLRTSARCSKSAIDEYFERDPAWSSTSSTSTPATSSAACRPTRTTALYCVRLAHNAVHAAMCGPDGHGGRPLARPVRARADGGRHRASATRSTPRRPVDVGAGSDRPAQAVQVGAGMRICGMIRCHPNGDHPCPRPKRN